MSKMITLSTNMRNFGPTEVLQLLPNAVYNITNNSRWLTKIIYYINNNLGVTFKDHISNTHIPCKNYTLPALPLGQLDHCLRPSSGRGPQNFGKKEVLAKKKKNGSWLNPKKKSTPSFWPKIFGLNKINCPKNNTFNLRQTKIYNQIRWKSSLRKLLTKQSQINTHKKSQIPKFYPCPLSLSLSVQFLLLILPLH